MGWTTMPLPHGLLCCPPPYSRTSPASHFGQVSADCMFLPACNSYVRLYDCNECLHGPKPTPLHDCCLGMKSCIDNYYCLSVVTARADAGAAANTSAFHLAAQLWPLPSNPPRSTKLPQDSKLASALHSSTEAGVKVALGWGSLFWPLTRRVGGPQALQVSVNLWPLHQQQLQQQRASADPVNVDSLTSLTSVKVADSVQQALASLLRTSGVSRWLSLSIEPLGPPQTATLPNTSSPSHVSACRHSAVVLPQQDSQSHTITAENVLANLTRYSLLGCLGETGAGCRAVVLLDPGCRYSLRLQVDAAGQLLQLILARLPELWLMCQALLLAHAARLVAQYSNGSTDGSSTDGQGSTGTNTTVRSCTGSTSIFTCSSWLDTALWPLQGALSAAAHCLTSPTFVGAACAWLPVCAHLTHQLSHINWEEGVKPLGPTLISLLTSILGKSSCSPSALAAAIWVAGLPLLPSGSAASHMGRMGQHSNNLRPGTAAAAPTASLPVPLRALEAWARRLVVSGDVLSLCYATFPGDTLRPLSPVEALLLLPLLAAAVVAVTALALALIRALVHGVVGVVVAVWRRRSAGREAQQQQQQTMTTSLASLPPDSSTQQPRPDSSGAAGATTCGRPGNAQATAERSSAAVGQAASDSPHTSCGTGCSTGPTMEPDGLPAAAAPHQHTARGTGYIPRDPLIRALIIIGLCGLWLVHMSFGMAAAVLLLLLLLTPTTQSPWRYPTRTAGHAAGTAHGKTDVSSRDAHVHAALQRTMCVFFALGALICGPSGWAWLTTPHSYSGFISALDICLTQPVAGACSCLAFTEARHLRRKYQGLARDALHACACAAFAAAVFGAGFAGYVVQGVAAIVVWLAF